MTPESPPAIDLSAASRRYRGSESPALDDVTLQIQAGEFVAIMGESGAGKSTLLNIVGLMDRPTAGSYHFFGHDVRALSERQRNALRGREIGFVFQSSHMLLDQDVVNNVALGLRCQHVGRQRRMTMALRALDTVGLREKYATPAKLLSGGERQRAAVARALATRPRLLLADEPTGSLDRENADEVMRLLAELNAAGTTVIVVTHDPATARHAGRIIRLSHGRVLAEVGAAPTPVTPAAPPQQAPAPGAKSHPALDVLRDSEDGLLARMLRTLLLLFAFTLGIAGLLAAVGLSSTAAVQVNGQLTEASQDQLVAALGPDSTMASLEAAPPTLRGLPHVRDVGLKVGTSGTSVRTSRTEADRPADVTVLGADSAFARMAATRLIPDNAGDRFADRATGGGVLVSRMAATALSIPTSADALGAGIVVYINSVAYPVVGVFDVSERAIEATRAVLVPPAAVLGLDGSQPELVITTEPGYPQLVAAAIPLALSPGNPGAVRTTTVADLQGLRVGVADNMSMLVAVVGAVVLAVAALGAASAQYLSVEARTGEIALRRALGSSRGEVAAIFLGEGAIVGLIGGIIGASLSVVTIVGLSRLRGWAPVIGSGAWWLGPALGLATGFLSALVPAWRASRKEPALAMRD